MYTYNFQTRKSTVTRVTRNILIYCYDYVDNIVMLTNFAFFLSVLAFSLPFPVWYHHNFVYKFVSVRMVSLFLFFMLFYMHIFFFWNEHQSIWVAVVCPERIVVGGFMWSNKIRCGLFMNMRHPTVCT